MNNRYGRSSDYREYNPSRREERPREHSSWEEEREQRAQPYLYDDDGDAYNRELERDERVRMGQGFADPGANRQRPQSRPGWYSRGHTGTYGSGGGGYHGGYASGGYGGSTGTDYSRGSHGGYTGGEYQGSQGSPYGTSRGRSDFGRDVEHGYRGDVGATGSELRRPQGGGFAGRGPKGYLRTDERIREDVCDRLSQDDDVDATEIEVRVQDGEVTLEGSVATRRMKHQAEDLAEEVGGVKDVHNRLRVLKGLLAEIKDELTGEQKEQHHANTGTKDKPGFTSANGRA